MENNSQPDPRKLIPTLRDKIDFNSPEALARREEMWRRIRSLESHTPQGRNPSAAYRAWDQARTPDLPLAPVTPRKPEELTLY